MWVWVGLPVGDLAGEMCRSPFVALADWVKLRAEVMGDAEVFLRHDCIDFLGFDAVLCFIWCNGLHARTI